MSRPPIAVLLSMPLLAAAAAPARPQEAGERVVHAWQFQAAADLAGWSCQGTTAPEVRDGALSLRTSANDPKLIAPDCDFPAAPFQVLAIRMRSSAGGTASVFWSGTTEGRYGGFEEAKRTDFEVEGDGRSHEYRLLPFWHAEKQILRFRLDPPDNADVAIESIRVLQPPVAPASKASAWDLPAGWRTVEVGRERILLSPPLDVDAEAAPWVACTLAAKAEGTGRLYWASAGANGLQSTAFTFRPGQRQQNVDAAGAPQWRGRLLALGLSLPEGAVARRISLADAPQGPADPEVTFFGLRDAVNRAGRPATLLAMFTNRGGAPAEGLHARVTLGAGMALAPGEAAEKEVPACEFGETVEVSWQVRAARPGSFRAALALAGAAPKQANALFTAPIPVAAGGYVPAPKPAASDYDVGVYYFPGWHTYSRWSVLNPYPERRPVLGYYREGSPEVADWQVKWALEHGIKFFIYDWYWSKGARSLEHALHDGLLKSRYGSKFKFCLLWANHNPAGTSSEQDLLNVTDYWLANYFKRPEYYTINGRPVVVIFSPYRFTADMGAPAVKAAFEKMRAKVKAAGLPDLFLVACAYPNAGELQTIKEEGYDAVSGYNYPGAGAENERRAPYSLAVAGYESYWKRIADSGVDYIPVTDPGWDSRPWHGENNRVRTGKTPALFRDMLLRARRFVDERTPAGRPKVVFVEAWNEFGEGDFIEPHREWGFGYLDAIRSVFTKAPEPHQDVTPADAGLGPYDLAPDPVATDWEFETAGKMEGWGDVYSVTGCAVRDGALCGIAANDDPAFLGPAMRVPALKFGVVEIRMKMDKGENGQLFWSTTHSEISEANSVRFAVTGDNAYHVYRIEVGKSPRWRGVITRLRLDPNSNAGSVIAIDYVKLLP